MMLAVTTWVALLRGINVGGNRRLMMSDLRTVVSAAGGTSVQTYIQSGNVVFAHGDTSASALRRELEHRIAASAGFAVDVVLRDGAELHDVMAANPFADAPTDTLHVAFLRDAPTTSAVSSIDHDALLPEQCVAADLHVYLRLPSGVGRSKLPLQLPRRLGVPVTIRNWATVERLAAMARSTP